MAFRANIGAVLKVFLLVSHLLSSLGLDTLSESLGSGRSLIWACVCEVSSRRVSPSAEMYPGRSQSAFLW